MPRVAVVQDGTEVVRQKDADVADFFDGCFDALADEDYDYEWSVVLDEDVGLLLGGLSPGRFGCIVFTSNSLLSDAVARAVARYAENLHAYLAAGGGLVLFHQARGSLSPLLPDDLRPELTARGTPVGQARAAAYGANPDVLLHYPFAVDVESLHDGGHDHGAFQLFWKAMRLGSLPEKLVPVLVTPRKEVLLARSVARTAERVVLCTIPLDFERRTELVANAIRFAAQGPPHRLLWRGPPSPATEMFTRWISLDGATAIRPAPRPGDAIEPADRWLLGGVDVCFAHPAQFDDLTARPEVREFLVRGGTVVTAEPAPEFDSRRVTALVGTYATRSLVQRLYAELGAVDGWDDASAAFEIRNVVSALETLWRDPVNRDFPGATDPRALGAVRADVVRRLRDHGHRDDVSSSIALAEALCVLDSDVDDEAVGWLADAVRAGEPDVALQVRAVRALARRAREEGFAAAALQVLDGGNRSFAPTVRVLSAIALLDEAALLDLDGEEAVVLGTRVADLLDLGRMDGWGGVESTADVVRAVVVLLSRLPPDAPVSRHLAVHLADGSARLREAVRTYERDARGVARLARVVHALVLVESAYPTGIQRIASLRWPERDDGAGAVDPALRGERSLVAHLTSENSVLRGKEAQLEAQRLAAAVGRTSATVLTTVALLALAVLLVRVVGLGSPLALIGNSVLVTTFLAVLVWLYEMLGRRDLLAAPFARLPALVKAAVPAVAALIGLRKSRG